MYIVLIIILAVAFILYIMYDYHPKEKPQPMHFDIITEEDVPVRSLRYFCIKDKGYNVTVWPKDQYIGDYLEFNIAGITHGAEDYIPGGNSVFHEGDTVVVVTSGRGVLQNFNDIFA